jgi:hypothetical protein
MRTRLRGRFGDCKDFLEISILASSAGAGQKNKIHHQGHEVRHEGRHEGNRSGLRDALSGLRAAFVSFVVSSWFISDAKALERGTPAFVDWARLLLHQQNFFRAVHLG